MGRRTILLIASILIAAVGTALIALYVRGADSRAREGTQLVSIQVASRDIPAGTPVSTLDGGGYLKAKKVALDSAPLGALPNTDAVAGQKTKVGIVADAPLQQTMFSKTGASEPSSIGVSEGRLAASFELTDPQRVANLLQPGMYVTVYYVPTQGDAKPAVNRVKVLQIGTQIVDSSSSLGSDGAQGTNPNADQVPRTILTLDLLQKDELKLLEYKRDGDLALGLVYDQKSGPSS